MAITTYAGTGNINQSRLVVDMAEKIAYLQPDAAPLTVILKRAKKRVVQNPKFEWMEQELGARWDKVSNATGYTATNTAINVVNGSYFTVGDLVKVPRTGEVMRVTAINGNTLTVVRGYGSTAAAALNDADDLLIIGNANAEGSGARNPNIADVTNVYNYTQIFKTTIAVTNTMKATKVYGETELARQRKLKGIEHLVDMERAFLFGEKKLDASGSQPIRTTAGVLSFLTENVMDAGGTLTELEFETWLEGVFKYGSNRRLLLASPRVCTVINQFAQNKLRVVPREDTYGVSITQYVSTHGELYIVKHPLLEGAIYGGMAIALDIDNVYYCPLEGRDTKLETNIQNNDEDVQKDQYITEAGIMVQLPKTHGILKDVTG